MKKDFFVYSNVDNMIFASGMTEAEANAYRGNITAEFPEEAHTVSIASVSADPTFAANLALYHIANW